MGRHKKKRESEHEISKKKHYDTFYASAPPGLIKEEVARPEDSIPDLPENKEAREFLAQAPSKGLWMPLGKEVKVMQCWRCKGFGHRSGDKECPMFSSGNMQTERFRWSHEDPMHNYLRDQERKDKEARVDELQALLDASSSSSSDTDSSDTSSDTQHRKRKRRKKTHNKESHKGDNHSHSKHSRKTDKSNTKHSSKSDKPNTKHSSKSDKAHRHSRKGDNRPDSVRDDKDDVRKRDKHKEKSHKNHGEVHDKHNSGSEDAIKSGRHRKHGKDYYYHKHSESDRSESDKYKRSNKSRDKESGSDIHKKHKKSKHKKKHKD